MKTFITPILALLLLAGCATQSPPIKLPPTIPLPPMPAPEAQMKLQRQSVRAFAASSATVTATVDTNSPNWGTVSMFRARDEAGTTNTVVKIEFRNWGTDSYGIFRSTDLVTWDQVVLSKSGGPSEVLVYDPEDHEFFRIQRVFVSP